MTQSNVLQQMYKHIELERVRPAIISFHNIIIYVCARKSFSTRELSTFILFFHNFHCVPSTQYSTRRAMCERRRVEEEGESEREETGTGQPNFPKNSRSKTSEVHSYIEWISSSLLEKIRHTTEEGKNVFPFRFLLTWHSLCCWLEC